MEYQGIGRRSDPEYFGEIRLRKVVYLVWKHLPLNLKLTSIDLNLVLRTEVCLIGNSIGSTVGTENWEDFITADSVDS